MDFGEPTQRQEEEFSGYCETLEKRTGSKPKKWKRRHTSDGSDVSKDKETQMRSSGLSALLLHNPKFYTGATLVNAEI